jgi:hypothetical protein
MSLPSASVPGVPLRTIPFDPVRFCVMTTVGLIAWAFGPPVCVLLMSALGLWAYSRAMRAGLRESRCVLKRPALVLGYLGLAFTGALVTLVYGVVT